MHGQDGIGTGWKNYVKRLKVLSLRMPQTVPSRLFYFIKCSLLGKQN